MNLTQVKQKIFIIIGGATLIIVAVLILSIITSNKKDSKPKTQPQPSIAPNTIVPPQKKPENLEPDVKKIREKIISSQIENKGGDAILFKSDSFVIRYIPSPNVFFVTIFKEPAANYKNEAQKWFLNFGLKQENLCDLPVRFILANLELRKNNLNFSSLPEGCSGQTLTKPATSK